MGGAKPTDYVGQTRVLNGTTRVAMSTGLEPVTSAVTVLRSSLN